MQDKIAEIRTKLASLEKLLPQLKKGKTSDDPKMPKTTEACQQAIEKEKRKIEVEEQRLQDKIDTKNYSLGTSKINYMDPRISISWCKANEVPIEKVFQSTLRSKFAWAMDNDPNWRF
jgi:DNA topoisomerase-1